MERYKDLQVLEFETAEAWISWLEKNHTQKEGIWLKFAKKGRGTTTINNLEMREGALCYGWIDGLANKYDDTYFVLRMTPRRPKGIWSKMNVNIAERLIKEGRMKPAGLKEIEVAKADGRWDAAYEGPANTVVPEDFTAALEKNPKAMAAFEAANKTNRFALIFRINGAKKPETRQRRIEKSVSMLEKAELPYPSKKKA